MITVTLDRKLRNLIRGKRWIIQGGVNTPYLNSFPLIGITQTIETFASGYGITAIGTFYQHEGDRANWVIDEECLFSCGEKLEQHPETLKKLIKLWKNNTATYDAFIKRLEQRGIHNLLEEFTQFGTVYRNAWSPLAITEHFTVWSDKILARISSKRSMEQLKELEHLVMPLKKSFVGEEEESALKIGLNLKKVTAPESERCINIMLLKKKYPTLYKKLRRHQKKFFWIRNNYKYVDYITQECFLQEIQERIRNLSEQQIQEKIRALEHYETTIAHAHKTAVKKVHLTKDDAEALHLVALIAWLHDQRKKINLTADHWAMVFLEKVSTCLKREKKLLQFMMFEEILDVLKGKPFDEEGVAQRLKGRVDFADNQGNLWLLTGKDFERLKEDILEKNRNTTVMDFRGTTASNGTVRGDVQVIFNAREPFKEGCILVTPMTRPDFVPLMKKAKAIITDEGGITSHAAIISRELGMPCIVGTRCATNVLKTGDTVEIRGDRGLVKIIKRA